ncbi:nacht and ankyrin domain protein [Ilyonectria robusta]
MSSHASALRREDFQIAVICAVGCEYDAVALAFDEIQEGDGGQLGNAPGDNNKYKTGRIGSHHVVLLLLPGMGKVNAASAAASLRSSYANIKLAILAGICGGVHGARTSKELLLGDVVISKSIVQYDLGRQHPGKFAPKDTVEDRLGRPSKDIRSLVAIFETRDGRDDLQRRASQALEQIQQKAMNAGHRDLYNRPTASEDRLFEPGYLHRHRDSWNCGCSESGACKAASSASCEELQCDGSLVPRSRLKKRKFQHHEGDALVAPELGVFIGCVGSGDTVMKSGLDRDRIAKDHDLIAFEMEGAGVWDEIPCIIVKAVCDYADSHKNKKWQDFAAARAASTTKALLDFYPNTDSPITLRTQFVSRHDENVDFTGRTEIAARTDGEGNMHVRRQYEKHERELLELLAAEHDAYKNFNPRRIPGTCEWFFKDNRYQEWLESTTSSIIWVSAGPGCGKSVLARSIVDQIRQLANPATTTVCYFFFKDGEERRTDSHDALSAILHQLFTQHSADSLIRQAADSYQNYGKSLRNNFHQLWQILTACVKETNAGEVVCVLDALDECSQRGREEILEALQTFYFGNRRHPSSRLKFLITSRPYDDLDMSFSKFKNSSAAEIYIRFDGDDKSEELRHEIDLVIDHKVDEFAEDFEAVDRQKISECLKAMDNRTYLWLSLTFDIIYRNRSAYSRASDIEDLLSQLPSGVFDAYEKILSRSQNEKRARYLLQIIIAATRPLTLDEVNYSLALQEQEFRSYDGLKSRLWRPENFKRTVKNLCGLFVSVYDNKVSLMHQTAREFLTSPELQNVWQGSIDVPLAHSTIFVSCVRLLSLKDLDMTAQGTSGSKALPFISYAAMNWTLHYKSQDGSKRDAFLQNARELCRISKGHIPTWVKVYRAYIPLPWSHLFHWTDLTLTSYFGLLEVAVHIVSCEDVDVNSRGGYFGTAVKAAAAQGHSELVQTLLRRGADYDTGGGHFRTALLAAASNGHPRTVRCLLNSGAKVTQEVVMAAARNFDGGKTLALLLEIRGDEIQITPEVIVAAAGNSSGERTIALLLEARRDEIQITPEVVAAAEGNRYCGEEIMALLRRKTGGTS